MTRVAIVTGGTRGISRAICERLRDEREFTVIANYAGNDDAARKFTDETGIATIKFDVGDFDAVQDACGKVAEEHGPIDVVVNNAGITRDGTLLKMSYEDWDAVMRTNLGGCFNLAKATFSGMKERGWGRIVNIGSINGQAGQYGQVNYAAAKSGIHGFTKALAQEGARFGITVNAIAPGYFQTDNTQKLQDDPVRNKEITKRIPAARWGQPSDLGGTAVFLASAASNYLPGTIINVDGGWMAR